MKYFIEIIKAQNNLLKKTISIIDDLKKENKNLRLEKLRLTVEGYENAVNDFAEYCGIRDNGRLKMDRKAIASALGMKVEELWPANNNKKAA